MYGFWCFKVEQVMDISKTFFLQPVELKFPFRSKTFSNCRYHGWISSETERWGDTCYNSSLLDCDSFNCITNVLTYNYDSLNPDRPGDLKEAFNVETFCNDIVSTQHLQSHRKASNNPEVLTNGVDSPPPA